MKHSYDDYKLPDARSAAPYKGNYNYPSRYKSLSKLFTKESYNNRDPENSWSYK